MSLDQDTITQQQEQLAVHRRRLAHLFQQQATLGAYTPPYVVLDVEKTQAAVRDIKALLREHSIPVEDHPDDDRPVQMAAPLPPALHQLRAPVGDFVGREQEIEKLVQALGKAATNGAAAIGGVRGMGGIGKTELAYAAAQRLAGQFRDAQLLIELRGASSNPLTPEQALQTVIYAFEREAKLPDVLSQLQAIYRSVLSGKRVLILADDAASEAQVHPLMPPPGCALLVTSRNRFSLPGMRPEATVDLGVLPPEQGEELLLEICPRIGEYTKELSKLCGYLPLALRVSASLLKENESRDVAHYLEELRAERLTPLSDRDNRDDPQASVASSLKLSYDTLEEAAKEAVCQMSVFPTSFDLEAVKAVVRISDVGLLPRVMRWLRHKAIEELPRPEDLLDNLRRRSLLEWDTAVERYSLHELVRVFAAKRLEDADEVRLRYATHYVKVADRVDALCRQGGEAFKIGLAIFDRERTHIDAGWDWAMTHANNPVIDELLMDYISSTDFTSLLRYDLRGESRLEAAVRAAQRTHNRAAEGHLLYQLGEYYDTFGETNRAISCYKQRLEIAQKLGDRIAEAYTLCSLVRIYTDLGDTKQANEFLEGSLVVLGKLTDPSDKSVVLDFVGSVYDALGDTQRAIELFEQSLAILRELNSSKEHTIESSLASWQIYTKVRDTPPTSEFLKGKLDIFTELSHLDRETMVLGQVAFAYADLGDYRAAINFAEQSLKLARRVANRMLEGWSLCILGKLYHKLGEKNSAISCYKQQLEIARELSDRFAERLALLGLSYVLIDYLHEIDHPNAAKRAADLAKILQRLAASQNPPPAEKSDEV